MPESIGSRRRHARLAACGTDADCLTGSAGTARAATAIVRALQSVQPPGSTVLCAPARRDRIPIHECPSGQTCNGGRRVRGRSGSRPAPPPPTAPACFSCDSVCLRLLLHGHVRDLQPGGLSGHVPSRSPPAGPDAECPAGQSVQSAREVAPAAPARHAPSQRTALGGEGVDGVLLQFRVRRAVLEVRPPRLGRHLRFPSPPATDPDAECPPGSTCNGSGACATSCNPTNPPAYASTPQPAYTCAFGAIAFNVSTWTFSNLGNNVLGVSGSSGVPVMTATGIPLCPGGSFAVAKTDSGGCTTTYSLSGASAATSSGAGPSGSRSRIRLLRVHGRRAGPVTGSR